VKFKRVHFVGIGGAGMSGIAKVLLEMGYVVTGSDLKESRNTLSLRKQGAKIFIGHRPDNVGDADLVVVSSAIPKNNREMKCALRRGIPVIPRAEMLAILGDGRTNVAVAGTHGKTTTTSMISWVLEKNGLDPTFLIGGELNDIGSNAKYGRGKFFIVEADESDGSLLCLKPHTMVVTNIEADHLDYYNSLDEIEEVFFKFVSKLPPDGRGIVCGDHPGVKKLIRRADKEYIIYGMDKNSDFYAEDVELGGFGSSFEVYGGGKRLGKVSLRLPGVHNVYNALATIALSTFIGLDFTAIADALSQFSGVQRRFQLVGSCGDVTLIDDYAHHPTEVRATIDATRDGDWKRIICIFQPHRFSRTRFLGEDFGEAFDEADLVILTDIYAAGEQPIPGVSGKLILNALLSRNPRKQVIYLPRKAEVERFLTRVVRKGDLVLIMGAGDIWTVGEWLLNFLRGREPLGVGA